MYSKIYFVIYLAPFSFRSTF